MHYITRHDLFDVCCGFSFRGSEIINQLNRIGFCIQQFQHDVELILKSGCQFSQVRKRGGPL
jgi:hypothetical protein